MGEENNSHFLLPQPHPFLPNQCKVAYDAPVKLVDVMQKAHNSEMAKSQQATIQGLHTLSAVDAVNTHHCFSKGKQSCHSHNENGGTHNANQQRHSPSSSSFKCGWCGRDPHAFARMLSSETRQMPSVFKNWTFCYCLSIDSCTYKNCHEWRPID